MVDPAAREVRPHQDVGVTGATLAAIGPTGTVGTPSRVLDGRGRLLLPGLVNCHTHLPMGVFRGTSELRPLQSWLNWVERIQAECDEEDFYWGALLSLCQMLHAGITTVADMYAPAAVGAAAVERSGIRGFLSESLAGGTETGRRGSLEVQLARAEDLARRWHGAEGGRIETGMAPHSVYACDESLLREVAQTAHRMGVGMHVHVAETAVEVERCQADFGRRPPRVLADCGVFDGRAVAAHCVHLHEDDVALLAEFGVGVAHNPASNLKLRSGVAPLPALRAAGVSVGLGTDSAGSNDRLDLWRDCYLAAVLHEWGDQVSCAWEALEMATAAGAAALRMGDRVGRLAPGFRADLILLDATKPHLAPLLDPPRALVYAARGDEVKTVMVDGRVVVEEGRLLTVEEDQVVEQCRRRATRLFAGGVPA